MTPKQKDILARLPDDAPKWLTDRIAKCGSCKSCVFHNVGLDRNGTPVRLWKCSQCPNCHKSVDEKVNNEYFGCPSKHFEAEKW